MEKIKEYKVVIAISIAELEETVNSHFAEGWQPIGGVFITQSPSELKIGNYIGVETLSHQSLIR